MKKYVNKFIIGCVTACGLSVGMSSCSDYLDVDKYFEDLLTLDSAFSKRVYAEGFMANCFDHMRYEMTDISGGGDQTGWLNFASDDLIRCDRELRVKRYQNAEFSADDQINDDHWRRVYEPVRKATVVIYNIDKCDDMLMAERADIKGQARFVRGYAHWHLLQRYGPVPLAPEEGFDISASYDELSIPRSTLDEIVDYVEEDFLLAALSLNQNRTSNTIGKPTPAAALFARARLLLYYASPLYNGNKDLFSLRNQDGTQLIPQEEDRTKWVRAAAALREAYEYAVANNYALHTVTRDPAKSVDHLLIDDLNPSHPQYAALQTYATTDFPNGWKDIDPYESYAQVFNGELLPSQNKEVIFCLPNERDGVYTMVDHSLPRSLDGWNCIAVTQKQVDAYAMKDGRSIEDAKATNYFNQSKTVGIVDVPRSDYDEIGFTTKTNEYPFTPGIDVSLQYTNREPRFYVSVAFNGTVWDALSSGEERFQNLQTFYWYGTADGKQMGETANIMRTGIGLKKYVHPEDSKKSGGIIRNKYVPSMRMADLMLMYAEALNELPNGTHVYNEIEKTYSARPVEVIRDLPTLRSLIKPIRMRAGVPDFSDAVYNDQEELRKAIKRERQIELFAEQKRYFDLRRWKDARTEERGPIEGCNIDMPGTDLDSKQAFHTRTVVVTIPKVFEDRQYLWPIPTYELKKNIRLEQNPGWN